MKTMSLKKYIKSVNNDQTVGIVAKLAAAGFDRDEIKDALPELLDELIMFDVLVPGPGGVLLETLDGPTLRALVDILFPLLWKRYERRHSVPSATVS